MKKTAKVMNNGVDNVDSKQQINLLSVPQQKLEKNYFEFKHKV